MTDSRKSSLAAFASQAVIWAKQCLAFRSSKTWSPTRRSTVRNFVVNPTCAEQSNCLSFSFHATIITLVLFAVPSPNMVSCAGSTSLFNQLSFNLMRLTNLQSNNSPEIWLQYPPLSIAGHVALRTSFWPQLKHHRHHQQMHQHVCCVSVAMACGVCIGFMRSTACASCRLMVRPHDTPNFLFDLFGDVSPLLIFAAGSIHTWVWHLD